MYGLITAVHIILCLALIMIVLLQTGKGSDLASAFGGGGSQAMFGGGGPASFLNKMTTAVAVLFMATSITLAYMSSGKASSIMNDVKETAPASQTVPAAGEESQPKSSQEKAGEAAGDSGKPFHIKQADISGSSAEKSGDSENTAAGKPDSK